MKRPDGTVSPLERTGLEWRPDEGILSEVYLDTKRNLHAMYGSGLPPVWRIYGDDNVLSLVVMAQLASQQPSDVEIARAFQHNDGPHSEISCEGCRDLNDIHNVNVRSAREYASYQALNRYNYRTVAGHQI